MYIFKDTNQHTLGNIICKNCFQFWSIKPIISYFLSLFIHCQRHIYFEHIIALDWMVLFNPMMCYLDSNFVVDKHSSARTIILVAEYTVTRYWEWISEGTTELRTYQCVMLWKLVRVSAIFLTKPLAVVIIRSSTMVVSKWTLSGFVRCC